MTSRSAGTFADEMSGLSPVSPITIPSHRASRADCGIPIRRNHSSAVMSSSHAGCRQRLPDQGHLSAGGPEPVHTGDARQVADRGPQAGDPTEGRPTSATAGHPDGHMPWEANTFASTDAVEVPHEMHVPAGENVLPVVGHVVDDVNGIAIVRPPTDPRRSSRVTR